MIIRIPEYYQEFRCLAGACPHTCCSGWEVVLDEGTAQRYLAEEGPLGERLRRHLQKDEAGDFCFPLSGGRCPFLDGENLCQIHRQLGEEATSVTCREHPRFTEEYGPFREITLSASCPAANALLLGSDAPLTFLEMETAEPEEAGDDWLCWLLPLRERMLTVLKDRRRPLKERLASFLELALEAQWLLDEERLEELPGLADSWEPEKSRPPEGASGLFPAAQRLVGRREVLEPQWRGLQAQAETAPAIEGPQNQLERVAVYFAFRYLLKTVNDGDLLSKAQLCVFALLTVERLAGVCGLSEALRCFSREIEHDSDNLKALQESFRLEQPLSLQEFFTQLSS